jgi:hypothetical protein
MLLYMLVLQDRRPIIMLKSTLCFLSPANYRKVGLRSHCLICETKILKAGIQQLMLFCTKYIMKA